MRILAPPNGYLYPLKGWVELLKVSCVRPEHAWGAWRESKARQMLHNPRTAHTRTHTHTHTHKVLTHVDLATLCTFTSFAVAVPD